jgi:hypothetical protein
MRQHYLGGMMGRSWAFDPINMKDFFILKAVQAGRTLPIAIHYDKVIWSGLSWAVGEIQAMAIDRSQPIVITYSSAETNYPVELTGEVYQVH